MNIGTSVTLEELEGFRERAAMGEINVFVILRSSLGRVKVVIP